MEKKHKDFILEQLIPFIRRENGAGFVMSRWRTTFNEHWNLDGVKNRPAPKCGSVFCVGGSIQALTGVDPENSYKNDISGLGLTAAQRYGLFYNFSVGGNDGKVPGWPTVFRQRFFRAKTTSGKAKVAADLLKAVVRTNGKILDPVEA